METPFKSLDINSLPADVKSYIYQTILEFEPYTTPETVVSVVARDPLKIASQLQAEGREFPRAELAQMYRISICLMEDGAKIEQEGLATNIYEAIRIAKERLINILIEIQNNVVSTQDRTVHINSILQQTDTIH